MTHLLIGVDLGTTTTKTAVFDTGGRLLAEAVASTPLHWFGAEACDQEPEDFYRGTVATIRTCLQAGGLNPEQVEAIGIAGQMAGVLGVDQEWWPSMPYDSWLDARCSADVEFLERELGEELVDRTGCPAMVNHAPKMRWWRREHPDAFARTAKFVMPSAYVAGRLAGLHAGDAFLDRTYLHFTGAADARSGTWSEDLLGALGVPAEKMPRIVDPSDVIGHLSSDGARDCGLPAGIPIVAGLGDTAAAALGAGIVRPNQLLDAAGTAAVFAGSSDTFRPDRRHRTLIAMRGAIENQWISLSYLSGGSLLGWFSTAVGGEEYGVEQSDFDYLTQGAEEVPAGSEKLFFVPHLDGRILPSNPSMRGAWVGLTRHHDRRHMLRAILESVAYEYAGYLRVLRELHPELQPDEARVVGGGARSHLWNEIKASVLGVPYVTLDRTEFGPWGAALVAGYGVGVFDDLAEAAARSTGVAQRHEPDAGERAVYDRMTEHYGEVLSALAAPFRELAREGALQPQEVRV